MQRGDGDEGTSTEASERSCLVWSDQLSFRFGSSRRGGSSVRSRCTCGLPAPGRGRGPMVVLGMGVILLPSTRGSAVWGLVWVGESEVEGLGGGVVLLVGGGCSSLLNGMGWWNG